LRSVARRKGKLPSTAKKNGKTLARSAKGPETLKAEGGKRGKRGDRHEETRPEKQVRTEGARKRGGSTKERGDIGPWNV